MHLPLGESPKPQHNNFGRARARVLFAFLCLALAAGVFVPSHGARAAFPTTGILDNFNRADENPLANGTWTCPARIGNGNLKIVSNAAVNTTSNDDCYWTSASFGPDVEAYATLGLLSNGECYAVFVRASNLGTASFQAYWAELCVFNGASNDTFTLYREVNNSPTNIASGIQDVSQGDSIGIEVIGTTVRMLYKAAAGTWAQVLSVTDTNISGSGRIGIHDDGGGSNVGFDDFGGGTIVSGRVVSSRSDTLSDSRPSATSNHTFAFTTNTAMYGSSISGSSTLTIGFPTAFAIPVGMDCGDVDVATGSQFNFNYPSCYQTATAWGFSATGSRITLTPPSDTAVHVASGTPITIKIGSNVTVGQQGGHWITNPSTGGVYTVSVGGTFGGSGNMLVSINAGVSVSAQVAESLAFTVSSVSASFPTTGILDNFNRADENPLGNGNWTCPLQQGHANLQIVSNQVDSSGGGSGSCYWSAASFGPDSEAYVTISTLPSVPDCVAVMARTSGENSSSLSAYWAEYCAVSGASNDTFKIYRFVNNTPSNIASGIQEVSPGDSIGLEVIGTTIRMLYKPSGGSWTQILSITNSEVSGSGHVGMMVAGQTARADNFGGGTVNRCPADDGATVNGVAATATSVPFGIISPNTFYQGCQDLIVSTNAGNGYSVTVQESSAMRTADGRFVIPDTTCGAGDCSVVTATTWVTPTKNGFGHTCFNQSGSDCNPTYGSGKKFKPLSNIAAGNNGATVAFDAVGPSSGGAGCLSCSTTSWSHTTNGSNRLLTVGVSVGNNGIDLTGSSLAATYNGVSMASSGRVLTADTHGFVALFYLVSPAAGTHTVQVTLSGGTADMEAGSVRFTGVDQTIGVRNKSTNTGNSMNPSVTVTSAVGDMVVDVVGYGCGGGSSNQTSRWIKEQNCGSPAGNGAQSTAAGAASVNMNYTITSDQWSMIGMDVVAFPGVGQTLMSSTGTVTNSTGRVKYRLSAGAAQPAGTYTTLISYIITGTY